MNKRIRKGCTVSVNQSFIEKCKRNDLIPSDLWKVVNVVPICGGKKVAYLVNTETLFKTDILTCNLTLV